MDTSLSYCGSGSFITASFSEDCSGVGNGEDIGWQLEMSSKRKSAMTMYFNFIHESLNLIVLCLEVIEYPETLIIVLFEHLSRLNLTNSLPAFKRHLYSASTQLN